MQTSISYVDGLGRPLQTVIVRGSADGQQDIMTNTAVYDSFGRQVKSFLPTPNSSTGGAYLPNLQALASVFYNNRDALQTAFNALSIPYEERGSTNPFGLYQSLVSKQLYPCRPT